MKKKFFSLRRQMVLVYLLGGALPMLLIIGILIGAQRRTMLEQVATAAVTELTMLKNTLGSQCNVLTDVSKRMYFDEELEVISQTQYTDYASVVDTYRTYTQLDDLEDYYSGDIEGIMVYLDNQTLTGNSQLAQVDTETRSTDWYKTAAGWGTCPVVVYPQPGGWKKLLDIGAPDPQPAGKEHWRGDAAHEPAKSAYPVRRAQG